jgi:protease secretion system outer membrane protein
VRGASKSWRIRFQRYGNRLGWFIAFGMLLVAQHKEVWGMSLREALLAASAHDPQFRSAAQERAAGEQAAVIGRSALLPQISYSNTISRNFNVRTQQTTIGPREEDLQFDSRSDTISLRQPLFSIDAFKRYQLGNLQASNAAEVFKLRELDLILRLADAYAALVGAAGQVDALAAQLRASREQRALAERMFSLGEGTRTDVLEASARFELLQVNHADARAALKMAQNGLLLLVGASSRNKVAELAQRGCVGDPSCAASLVMPSWSSEHGSIVSDAESQRARWLAIAEISNQELQVARNQIDLAKLELQRVQGQHAPRLDLFANYGRSSSESVLLVNQQFLNRGLGVQFSLPLYAGGLTSAQVSQSISALERARIDYEGKFEKVAYEIDRYLIQINQAIQRFKALRESERSIELLILATRKSIAGGYRIPLHVMEAESQLVQTRLELLKTMIQLNVADIRLRATSGVLSADDLSRYSPFF